MPDIEMGLFHQSPPLEEGIQSTGLKYGREHFQNNSKSDDLQVHQVPYLLNTDNLTYMPHQTLISRCETPHSYQL